MKRIKNREAKEDFNDTIKDDSLKAVCCTQSLSFFLGRTRERGST